jgi:hypothetical protein
MPRSWIAGTAALALAGMRREMEKVDFKFVRGGFRYGNNHIPIQNFYVQEAARVPQWVNHVALTRCLFPLRSDSGLLGNRRKGPQADSTEDDSTRCVSSQRTYGRFIPLMSHLSGQPLGAGPLQRVVRRLRFW